MNLDELRQKLNEIDANILELFLKRMDVVQDVAKVKAKTGYPTFDKTREDEKIATLRKLCKNKSAEYVQPLFNSIFEISRDFQAKNNDTDLSSLYSKATFANEWPKSSVIAVPGVRGSFSEYAANLMFTPSSTEYCGSFEGVFNNVASGNVQYGVLPIENSTAGSVVKVYNLLNAHDFKIVKSIKCKINHNLAAKNGVNIKNIREIISHEQALWQCEQYIKNIGQNIKVTIAENTATAAKIVSECNRDDIAAICSKNCAELYNLKILDKNIQDEQHNYTRFICISKRFEIYKNANRISILLTLPHAEGTLLQVLKRLYAKNINVLKLESRPKPGSEFEFMFYIDIEADVLNEDAQNALAQIAAESESFRLLGCYEEIGELN